MKLYTVSVELETLVWAESPGEAREIAKDNYAFEDQLSNLYYGDYDARETGGILPCGWTPDALVYHGERSDLTVKECMDAEAKESGRSS